MDGSSKQNPDLTVMGKLAPSLGILKAQNGARSHKTTNN